MKISKKVKRLVSVALSAAMVFSMGMTSVFGQGFGDGPRAGNGGRDGGQSGEALSSQSLYAYVYNPEKYLTGYEKITSDKKYITVGEYKDVSLPQAQQDKVYKNNHKDISEVINGLTPDFCNIDGISFSNDDLDKVTWYTLHTSYGANKGNDSSNEGAYVPGDTLCWHLDGTIYKYNIVYEYQGDAPEGYPLPEGQSGLFKTDEHTLATIRDVPEGYEFKGWYYQGKPVSGTLTDFSDIPTSGYTATVKIVGKWTKKQQYTYTLTYDENKPAGVEGNVENLPSQTSDATYQLSHEFTVSTSTPTLTGYKFLGWAETENGTEYVTSVILNSSAPTKTLYAIWAPQDTYVYKLEYVSDIEAQMPNVQSETSDKTTYQLAVTTEKPVAEGYTFAGWTTDPEGNIPAGTTVGFTYDADEDLENTKIVTIKLYAKWTKNAPLPEPVEWDHSKSKTATNLDENYESTVTLSLPSAEEQLVTDIVFVLDSSENTSAVAQSAIPMLESLYDKIKMNDAAKIKVGVIKFRGNATDKKLQLKELDDSYIGEIRSFLNKDVQPTEKGSNMHAGLLAAQKMLGEDTSTDNDRKYMILISDGVTYTWDQGGQQYGASYAAGSSVFFASNTMWGIWYGDDNYDPAKDNSYQGWNDYLNQKKDLIDKTLSTYATQYDRDNIRNPIPADKRSEYASSIDVALYKCNEVYQELQRSQYHCYVQPIKYANAYGCSFMNYLANGQTVSFDSIQNDILYLLDAGSTVEDYMGYVEGDYDFDFVNEASKLSMYVGDEKYDAVKTGENEYSFAEGKYILKYIPGNYEDEEHFVWTINVPVSNFAPVSLTYTVKLTNPKTEAGTYGTYDADGSNPSSTSLYTNNSATLYPVDSNEHHGDSEAFNKPTVSYTVAPTQPASPDTVDINATKRLIGANLSDYAFQFMIEDVTGGKDTVLEVKTNDAYGIIDFSEIEYKEEDAEKTFTYIVTEVEGRQANINYDDTRYQVDVAVSKDASGKLVARVSSIKNLNTGADVDSIVFTNSYSERYYPIDPYEPPTSRPSSTPSSDPVEIEDSDAPLVSVPEESSSYVEIDESSVPLTDIPDDEVPLIDKTPQTSDESNLTIWLIVLAVSALGLVVALVFEKKNRYQPRHYR